MQLTLFKDNRISILALPKKPIGQYWITQANHVGVEEKVIGVEGIEHAWILKSNSVAVIVDDKGQKIKELIVQPLNFYRLLLQGRDAAMLYSEPLTEDRNAFTKLALPPRGKVTIGRAESADICFANSYVSSRHAELEIRDDGTVMLRDLKSINGTFVNGHRIAETSLAPGDVMYIMGLRAVYIPGMLAINNPDQAMTYNPVALRKSTPSVFTAAVEDDEELSRTILTKFYRSPRLKRDVTPAEIKIDLPTPMGNQEQTPLILLLGPAMTMGLTSALTAMLAVQNVLRNNGDILSAAPALVMSFGLLVGSILWPVLTKRYERLNRLKKESLRQEKYRKYIESIRNELKAECLRQQDILHENHLPVAECVSRVKSLKRNLWERSTGHNDFLRVRLGLGQLPLSAEIKFPERRFTLEDDALMDELYSLVDEPKMLRDVPVTYSLIEEQISGIIGERRLVIDTVINILVQLVALHSYDELKLVFIYDQHEESHWSFSRWLPHAWNEDRTLRFVATCPQEVKELSAALEKEIMARESIDNEEVLAELSPHYVVFAMSKTLAERAEMLNMILKHKKNYGFSVVTLFDELKYDSTANSNSQRSIRPC